MTLLEICCYSMECARTAQQNGADRIELCSAPKEGGLTPSLGVLRSVRQHVSIPVNPIIRPRGGDFCYTDGEFAAMLDDIAMVRDLGFSGLVTGILDVDGNVDMPRMEKIMVAAGPLNVTFHRAFDMCANPLNALNKLSDLGVARVLTSGQKSDAAQGLTKIMELIEQVDAPIIMAGAGFAPRIYPCSSKLECRKSTVLPEYGWLHPCGIAIRGCRCLRIRRRMNIPAMRLTGRRLLK